MAISLSQLCVNAEKSYAMKLIAGSGGLENTVRWVHIVEDSEVPDFLHGNELIFTTGIAHSGTDWLKGFAESLKAKGVVGLVVNIGPYIESVPSPVIVYCEQNDLPLFTIPWSTRIVDISYDFCRRMLSETGAFVTPGDCFEIPRSFRVGYACDAQTLKDGLAAMSDFFRTLEREGTLCKPIGF